MQGFLTAVASILLPALVLYCIYFLVKSYIDDKKGQEEAEKLRKARARMARGL